MAESGAEGPAKASLTAAQKQLHRRRQELDYWQKNAARLRRRNLVTGLAIGAFVVGMCILQRLRSLKLANPMANPKNPLCVIEKFGEFS